MTTGKERIISRLNGSPIGNTPIFLRDFTIGLDVHNIRTTDVFTDSYDAEKSSDVIAAFQRFCGQDAVVGCVHSPAFIVEQFGGRLRYPEYGIPIVTDHPVKCPSSLDRFDPSPKGKTLNAIASYSLVREKCRDCAIAANITGPLTKASVLMGAETLAMSFNENPAFVKDTIEKGIESTYSFLETLNKNGSMDFAFVASATDNPDLFGSDIYERFTIPYLEKITSRIHDMGYRVAFHPHGTFTDGDILSKTIATGIDGFQYAENNDPPKICAGINGRCAVMGGTDIVPTLLSKDDDKIRSETKEHIDACRDENYIFMCSCSLQRGTPLSSVRTMVDETRRLTNGARQP